MRSYTYKKKRGFTLIELLVVISIIALLIAILLPSLGRARELANEAVCAANVRGIIQSMFIYAQTNQNDFPASYNASSAGLITAGGAPGLPLAGVPATPTAIAVMNAWQSSSQNVGDPLSCLWLLVVSGQDTTKSFICPSDPQATLPSTEYLTASGANSEFCTNFNQSGTGTVLSATSGLGASESYSLADPWSGNSASTGGWWTNNAGSDLPLISDMAPGSPGNGVSGAALRNTTTAVAGNTSGNYIYNSGNHGGAGQNVGFGDDHVTFETNPYVGQNGDNIFTYLTGGTGTNAGTQNSINTGATTVKILTSTAPFDTCMVPVRDVGNGNW